MKKPRDLKISKLIRKDIFMLGVQNVVRERFQIIWHKLEKGQNVVALNTLIGHQKIEPKDD